MKKQKAKTLLDDAKQQLLSPDYLIALLRRKQYTTKELIELTGSTRTEVMRAIRLIQDQHILLYQFGDHWGIDKTPAPYNEKPLYLSRKDNTYLFGVCSDQHLCSKYSRLDVLDDLYKWFADEGVDRVFNGGNWIDGESRFNKHELLVHGMDNQIEYMVDHFPQKKGIITYSVAGDDHEGWYAQREGIDIGKHAEAIMRENGRDDWVNLGYMESYVALSNVNSKKTSQLLLQHPGGGSSYALSYVIQKIIESLEGGEKPAVLLSAHYHKLWAGDIRNVWAILTGCTEDQTSFMRKKRLAAHVGGLVVKLTQDPQTGAITRCRPEMVRYFNKGYYNNRWSHASKITLPKRGMRG